MGRTACSDRISDWGGVVLAGGADLAWGGGTHALGPSAFARAEGSIMKKFARFTCGVALLLCCALPAMSHEGHDHEAAAPVVGRDAPQRLPDGRVFLPKPAQRQMDILTMPVAQTQLPRVVELPGKVIMDPHVGGRVQAMMPGRIEAASTHGLPPAGSRVRKGEVLAWVTPSTASLERAGTSAQLAEVTASLGEAKRRVQRYRELTDIVARKDLEAAENEVKGLEGRVAALTKGLNGREALVAPVSGILAASNAVVGQVVEPKELIFEIIDPNSLHIEAMAYEPIGLGEVAQASIAVGEQVVSLNYIGAPRRLREQALPLIFESHSARAGLSLPLGQPVNVHVQMKSQVTGIPLPLSALTRNTANEPVVWIKHSPERFEMRPVQTLPLDGVRVMVRQGLSGGERVVVRGASLISQIR